MESNIGLVSDKELEQAKRERSKNYIFKNINPKTLSDEEALGWELHSELKASFKVRKAKKFDEVFENRVWLLLNKMGFSAMNKDRTFKLAYGPSNGSTQQIDVFAADDETVLFVECKSTQQRNKTSNFKKEIESIPGQMQGLIQEANRILGGKKRKAKFIFATENYNLSGPDKERIDNTQNLIHFGNEEIEYYEELVLHLGPAARFQLLGYLFSGQKIPDMHSVVPAIEGDMGGHKYYSFSIEPEKLLKLGYVLHRNNINSDSLPTYQRLINRNRLKKVRSYVNEGGFFPNSIIVNIDAKKLNFDPSSLQDKDSISKIGLLHLPQLYRSVYIIDGQHRLYGYSGSKYASTNTIPVVAFVNLDQNDQVRMFMDINENQKAVSKNLRNTLNADLKWESPVLSEQREALRLRIAQRLGEDRNSPLFERIVVGEEKETATCYLTLDAFSKALAKTKFLIRFGKNNEVTENGTFDQGDASPKANETTFSNLYELIRQVFLILKTNGEDAWNKDKAEDGALLTNSSVQGVIQLLDDLINNLKESKEFIPLRTSIKETIELVEPYLNTLLWGWNELPDEEKRDCRKSYGEGGAKRYWMTFRRIISEKEPKLVFDGLEKYWKDRNKQNNLASYKMIQDLEAYLKKDIHDQLLDRFGTEKALEKDGMPRKIVLDAKGRAEAKNLEIPEGEPEVGLWDNLFFIDYREIITYGKNWSEIFDKQYTIKGEEQISGGKDAKTAWLQKLNAIRNKVMHNNDVTKDEFDYLKDISSWLLNK